MTASVVFRDCRYNGRTLWEGLPDESDVDLLIVLPQVEDKLESMLALRKATAHIPVPLDILPTDPDEVARGGEEVGSVLRLALRHGRVLHERAT